MSTTKQWAEAHGISSETILRATGETAEPYLRSAREIAIRAIVLHGIAAVAYGVEADPVIDWFEEQSIWNSLSRIERTFISKRSPSDSERSSFRWRQESEWTLLWMIQRVDHLGLPTSCCDTGRLVDEVMPGLGTDVSPFIEQSQLRTPGELLAEDDRSYDLWCHAASAQRRGDTLPADLNLGVLRERRYAFEWIGGTENWDDVTCDA